MACLSFPQSASGLTTSAVWLNLSALGGSLAVSHLELGPGISISVETLADHFEQPTAATTAPPAPTVQTVTESGTVRTVTVTPTGSSSPNDAGITSQSNGLGTGAAVGIAVAVVAIVVAAAVVAFFVWRRKKQRDAQGMVNSPSPRGSSAGMMSTSKATEAGATPPYIDRTESDQSGRRRSTLMPIDPRIDPAHSGIYNRDGNISRDSINTLRDDQDYSRRVHQPAKVLRATNPDPDD